jgi:hypothetical protein
MTAESTTGTGTDADAPPAQTEAPASTEQVTAPDVDYDERSGVVIGSGGSGIVRNLGHDDFDPVGTLVLIGIYFVILTLMWIFMYFFEFLGGDLTVIG